MKTFKGLCLALLIWGAGAVAANAWFAEGYIYCDANQNGQIDVGVDVGLQSVLMVVVNTSGTFSNASWTAADGFFIVEVPEVNDSYVVFASAATLAAGSVTLVPAAGLYSFTITSNQTMFAGDFLINTGAACPSNTPPTTGACWLTGGGTIKAKGKPEHSFGGVVYPGCNPKSAGGGNWNHVAHSLGLHFKGTEMGVVTCGNIPGIPPGSQSPKTPFNYIEFQGTGTLKGIGGNQADYGQVYFFAHCEDRHEPGKGVDRYYLRVYAADGTTLLLVSADSANPLDVAPVAISTGNLQIHVSSCP